MLLYQLIKLPQLIKHIEFPQLIKLPQLINFKKSNHGYYRF